MPKKIQSNPKAVEARERKEGAKREKAEKDKQAKEDASWVETDKHILSKEDRKKKDEEKRVQEAERKKAAREALAKEEAELDKSIKKAQTPTKVTQAEIARRKEIEAIAARKREEQEKKRQEEVQENMNRVMQVERAQHGAAYIEARSVEDAVGHMQNLGIGGTPEKKIKVTYANFEERTLPDVRLENPSLKLSQLKELVWKLWQKSPDNPINQIVV